MAEPPAKPATAAAGEADAIAALRAQLADRDRRLAELTEHSLRILDELARERAEAGDRQALRAQNARLQELLADTRARIRQAANVVVAGPLPAVPFEVVSWGVEDLEDKRVQRQVEACGGVPITILAGDAAQRLATALPTSPFEKPIVSVAQYTELLAAAVNWVTELEASSAEPSRPCP